MQIQLHFFSLICDRHEIFLISNTDVNSILYDIIEVKFACEIIKSSHTIAQLKCNKYSRFEIVYNRILIIYEYKKLSLNIQDWKKRVVLPIQCLHSSTAFDEIITSLINENKMRNSKIKFHLSCFLPYHFLSISGRFKLFVLNITVIKSHTKLETMTFDDINIYYYAVNVRAIESTWSIWTENDCWRSL